MKKHSMILALIVALTMAFVFIGCGVSTGQVDATGDPREDPSPPGGTTTTPFELKIAKNEYSDGKKDEVGNQAKISFADLGTKVGSPKPFAIPQKDTKYSFSITFTSDLTGTADADSVYLSIALVDTSEVAEWWDVRGEWSDMTGNVEGDGRPEYANIGGPLTGSKTFSGILTVIPSGKSASGSALGDYNLVFAMEAQPWDNEATLTFSSFSFYQQ